MITSIPSLLTLSLSALLMNTVISANLPNGLTASQFSKMPNVQTLALGNHALMKSLSTKNLDPVPWSKRGKNDDEIYVYDQDWVGWNENGEARNTLEFSDLVNITATWGGVPFYLDQFTQQKDRNASDFYVPDIGTNVKNFKRGFYYMIDSCDAVINTEQHNLNYDCLKRNFTDLYVGMIIYGLIGKMNFQKDGLLFRSCGIIKLDAKNETCAEIFPTPSKDCKVTHISDHTVDADLAFVDQGYLIQSNYYTKKYAGLSGLVNDIAVQTGKQFTLPDGSLTKTKRRSLTFDDPNPM